MDRIEKIIEEIELEYVEFVEHKIEERKKLLPLKKPRQIRALIWNLFHSQKWSQQLSHSDYDAILDVWISRLNKDNLNQH
jgi:hypothetical protein